MLTISYSQKLLRHVVRIHKTNYTYHSVNSHLQRLFFLQGFTFASHAESSFVGASDVSHSICCNYCYYSGMPDQRPDTRCVTKDI